MGLIATNFGPHYLKVGLVLHVFARSFNCCGGITVTDGRVLAECHIKTGLQRCINTMTMQVDSLILAAPVFLKRLYAVNVTTPMDR